MSTRTRHHRHRSRFRGFGYFSRLGPGLITGASDDDPSGIGTYSQVGAAYRFGFLWTVPLTFPLAAAMQELSGRLGLVTGHGLARLIKDRFPRWVLLVAVGLVASANIVNIAADLGAMASSARLVVPQVPYAVVLIGGTLGLLALEVLLPYRSYAKVLRWLTVSLLAYVAVLFMVGVDWGAALRATLVPAISWTRSEIAALIAILGTTISPYLFFWQTSEEVEVEEEEEEEEEESASHRKAQVDRAHIRAMRGDVVAGMASAVFIMWAIMVASSETLGARGITEVSTASQAAAALEPTAGSLAGALFALGIVGTGSLAVPVLAGSAAYAIAEASGAREGLGKTPRDAPVFYSVVGGAMMLGLSFDLLGLDPVRALFFAAVVNGLAAPFLILLMLLLSVRSEVLGGWRSGRVSAVLVGASFVAMTALPALYLIR